MENILKKIISLFYMGALLLLLFSCENDRSSVGLVSNGQGGSMAKFTIYGNYLYTVKGGPIQENFNRLDMQIFDISNPAKPIEKGGVQIGFDIETIFSYQSKLFIGSQSGMYIYSIADPEKPALLSTYYHIASCDPVVAQGDYAYYTLRNGTACWGGQNLLDIVDISNPLDPQEVSSTPMVNPYGLAISDSILYVCEGPDGFKVFNVKEPKQVSLIASVPGIFSYDVIAIDTLIIITGEEGIYQYGVSNPLQPKLLSTILNDPK